MIDTFMSITGASESVALQKLEEYGGNLNAAVSAHFLEMERNMTNQSVIPVPRQHSSLNPNYQSRDATTGIVPLLSSIRSFRPSLLLDPNYRRSLINQIGSSSFNANTVHSPAQEGWRFPLQHDQVNVPPNYPEPSIHGNATRDNSLHLNNDRESEMIQAAIEASKREAESNHTKRQSGLSNLEQVEHHQEDEEVARAISLSLKTAEEDDVKRALEVEKEFECLKNDREKGTKGSSCWQGEGSSARQKPTSHNLQRSEDTVSAEVFEKELNTEEMCLPREPAINNDNAVSLVVRMPDGTRHGRRFLKSDKLKFIFNFIDADKGVKPGTYSLVRSYPRQAFGVADTHLSLRELGLTGKQEALFLEFM